MILRPPPLRLRPLLPRRRRAYSTQPPPPPAPPPAKGIARLTDRALLSVHGADAPKFLQGLVTSQVPPPDGSGTYSCFLNSQGRVLSDAFIYPSRTHPGDTPPEPHYLVELSAPSAPRLLATLQRRKLRSRITLSLVPPSELSVWALWDDTAPTTTFPTTTSNIIRLADTRAPAFGHRLLLPAAAAAAVGEGGGEGVPAEVGLAQYTLRRYLHGVPEGAGELAEGVALPQRCCVDYMGGIDFRKGCYVGQELTIRTHHMGIVRRRVLPVQFSAVPFGDADGAEGAGRVVYDPGVELPGGGRGRAGVPGVVVGAVGNVGLALCKLGVMTRGEFVVGEEGREVWVRAVVPEWHRERAEALRR
ncbi:hypothetical protein DFP73DRAFT_491311 [Morchella snyderi]|nr:hypothetical protein DFP73DRAFT_491311 [Morchella snyderi]